MSEYKPSPSKWVADQVELYERTGGAEGGVQSTTGLPVVIVTYRGRKSGAVRKIPLMMVKDGENYVLVASKGGTPENPQWYYNLKADPNVMIRDKTYVHHYRVREVTDPKERKRLWKIAVKAFPPYAEYQTKTERIIPVFLAELVK